MADMPPCPRGCASARVVLDGVQRKGGRPRQRFRCISSDGSYHRFIGALGRTRSNDHTCVECENNIAAHEGPAAPAEFEYLVREVAQALVRLGQGASYTDVAKRTRLLANRDKDHEPTQVTTGQTVAEWVADFVPVVAARHQETAWPEVLVLDSTEFMWKNPRTGTTTQLFTVMAAYGYDAAGLTARCGSCGRPRPTTRSRGRSSSTCCPDGRCRSSATVTWPSSEGSRRTGAGARTRCPATCASTTC